MPCQLPDVKGVVRSRLQSGVGLLQDLPHSTQVRLRIVRVAGKNDSVARKSRRAQEKNVVVFTHLDIFCQAKSVPLSEIILGKSENVASEHNPLRRLASGSRKFHIDKVGNT